MKWISIKDQLPEKDIPVLCFYSDSYQGVFEYWYQENGKAIFWGEDILCDTVTHWMPLPDAPKDEERKCCF